MACRLVKRAATIAAGSVLLGFGTQRAVAQPIPVTPELKVHVAATDQFDPAVDMDAAGNFVVIWHVDGGALFGRRYDSRGVPFGPEFEIDAGYAEHTALAVDPAGNFLAVWSDCPGTCSVSNGVFARLYDATGAPQGPEFEVSTITTNYTRKPDVAVDAAGNFVVVWQLGTNSARGRRIDAAGALQGGEFVVGAAARRPAVAKDAAGNFVVVWDHFSGSSAQRYDAAGVPQGSALMLPYPPFVDYFGPAVAAEPGGAFVTVHRGVGQRWDAGGMPVGAPWDFLTDDVQPVIALDGAGTLVAAAAGGSNSFSLSVDGQRYDAAGVPLSPPFLISSSRPISRLFAQVDALADSRYVVAWQQNIGFDSSRSVVFVRLYGFEARVAGTKLRLSDGPSPSDRRVFVRVRDPILATRPGAGVDPVANGAYLHVFNADGSGESACLSLPSAGWEARGSATRPTFRYEDPDFALGPCSKATLRDGSLLRVSCEATAQPIAYSLDEAQQGSVGVRLVSGDATYCTLFGGTIIADSGTDGVFSARRAPAPDSCPTPPAACP